MNGLRDAPGSDWSERVLRSLCLILPVLLFLGVVFGEPPRTLIDAVYFRDPILVLLLFLALVGAYRANGRVGVLLSLSATLLLFAVELAGHWGTAASGGVTIGGLLPWSDAQGYYRGAELLTEGADLEAWHGRRPLFVVLLAVVLELAAHNLQWTVALLVVMSAVACFLLALQLRSSFGPAAAATAVLFLWTFHSKFATALVTEHLGFSLGILALVLLIRGARERRPGLGWSGGLLLLTVALAARAGAFFVLPALLGWGAVYAYRTGSRRDCARTIIIGSAAIAAGFVLDGLIRSLLVSDAVAYGSFSHTFYGVVVGNKGWLQVAADHPGVKQLGDGEAAREIYRLAFEALRNDPLRGMSGALDTWADYFSFGGFGFLSFVGSPVLQVAGIVLCGLGLVRCLLRRRDPACSMLLAMTAGVLASVPFVPPRDSRYMEVYAATMPLVGVLLALALASRAKAATAVNPEEPGSFMAAAASGVSLVLLIICGAMVSGVFRQPVRFPAITCPDGERGVIVRLREGSFLRLVGDDAPVSRVPELRLSDFRAGLNSYGSSYPELRAELMKLQTGEELRFVIDLTDHRFGTSLWLVTNAGSSPPRGVINACASLVGTAHGQRFYRTARRIDSRQ